MKKLALVSVHNKEGIVNCVRELVEKYNYDILTTGGTATILRNNNISVTEVSDVTKFPEMLEGRVKTLHPVIHAGVLAKRNKSLHMETIARNNIRPIDLVIVNLYPFEEVSSKPNISIDEIIDNIDIGGPTLIRSAAKNYSDVTVISSPSDYPALLKELAENNGKTSLKFRESLLLKAFQRTSSYDTSITNYFLNHMNVVDKSKNGFPNDLNLNLKLKTTLRYGENPHQNAALYLLPNSRAGLANAELLQGKELSFNNYLDLESAWNIASEFNVSTPVAVIVKHNSPCGVAIAPDLHQAYSEALYADSVSAFGGIVAFNNVVDTKVASETTKIFLEAVIAPNYTSEALELFKKKPNLRILKIEPHMDGVNGLDIKVINEGFLIQNNNRLTLNLSDLKVVTQRKLSQQEMVDAVFVWKVCKHVKSNAIVVGKGGKTLGIGAGQTSRIGAVEIALNQANYNSKGAVLASDGFFPFQDSVEAASQAGISAMIQPGGSKKDQEVIDACNKYDIAMVFTGIRQFKH